MSWPASEPDRQPRRREPIFNTDGKAFTLAFAAVCVGVYLYQSSLSTTALYNFFDAFALTPRRFLQGLESLYGATLLPAWLPLFSHMLLHGGFWHLFLNMIALLSFGPPVEPEVYIRCAGSAPEPIGAGG